jgi:hypothetical protein
MTIALNGTTGYLNHPARIANSYPFSMAVWVAASTSVANQFAIQQAQSNGDRYASGWFTSFGGNQLATTRNPGNSLTATKNSAPALSASVMRLMIVVFESATVRRVYFGSSTPVTDTGTAADETSNHDRCTLGGFWSNGAGAPSLLLSGSLAEAHWFSTALTGTDYTNMAGGTLPETVGGWIDGWTLETFQAGGTYTSIGGARTMTAVGGVTTSGIGHPVTRGGDTTAPTLTSPTGTQTGGTSASGTVTTNEANGTLFRLASINATESVATVKAANITQAVTATGVQNVTFTGLSPSTTYFAHYVHTDAANNDSARVSSSSFTTTSGDATAPTLTGSITVSALAPTSYTLAWPAGSDNIAVTSYERSLDGGSSWVDVGNVLTVGITGRTPGNTDAVRVRAKDGSGNVSTPALSASVNLPIPTITSPPVKNNTGTVQASATIPKVTVLRLSDMTIALNLTNQTTSAGGILTIANASLVQGTGYVNVLANADGSALGVFYGVAA